MVDFMDSMGSFFKRKQPKTDEMSEEERRKRRFALVEEMQRREQAKNPSKKVDPGYRFGKNVSDILGGKVKKP